MKLTTGRLGVVNVSLTVLLQRKHFLLFPYFNLENNVPFSASHAGPMTCFMCKEGNECFEFKKKEKMVVILKIFDDDVSIS